MHSDTICLAVVLDDSSLVESHKIYYCIICFQDLHLKIGIVTRVICMAQASGFSLRRLATMRAFS